MMYKANSSRQDGTRLGGSRGSFIKVRLRDLMEGFFEDAHDF